METIEAVTEAFSMQPVRYNVCTVEKEYDLFTKESRPHKHDRGCITAIKFEKVMLGHECGDPVEKLMYIGYDVNGNKLFQFLATSVNVHYKPMDTEL